MKRVAFSPNYGTGQVNISGNDGIPREVPAEIFPLQVEPPTVALETREKWGENAASNFLLSSTETK